MNTWNGDTRVLTPKEKQIDHFFHFYLGDTVKGIGAHFGRVFNLHTYLLAHRHVKPSILAKRITLHGKPLFTEAELTKYFKKQVQRGGAGTEVYDKMFRRIGAALPGGVGSSATDSVNAGKCPPGFNFGILGDIFDKIFFAMYHLEQIPVVGQLLIAPAFDAVTLGIPAASEVVETGIHIGAGLLPVPGIVGEMAGTIAECVLSFIATCMNISRKQFGSAFKTGLGIVPFAGEILSTSAQQFEIGLGRYLQRRSAMIDPVRPYSPTMGKLGNAYLPTLDIPTEPAPPLSLETVNKVKEELVAKVQETAKNNPQVQKAIEGLQKVGATVKGLLPSDVAAKLEAQDIPGATILVVDDVKDLVGSLASGSLTDPTALIGTMTNKAKSAAANAVGKATNSVRNTVGKAVSLNNKVSFKPMTIRKKRRSNRRRTRRA
jgi:hypothetical protein